MSIPALVKEKYDNPRFICEYNGYQVYSENYGEDFPAIGMPEFLLFKDDSVRYATENEINAIFEMLPDD
jgi:hypothetical protein